MTNPDIYGHGSELIEDFTHYALDPDLLEMRQVLTDTREHDDPWLSQTYWDADLMREISERRW